MHSLLQGTILVCPEFPKDDVAQSAVNVVMWLCMMQMHGGQMGGLAFSAPQPPALSYGAPEPHSSHYPPSFQPAPAEYTPQSATQVATLAGPADCCGFGCFL